MDVKTGVLSLNALNNDEGESAVEEPVKEYPKVEVNNQYYAKGLDVEQKKYNVLLEQRRQIINGIEVNKKSFHTSIFSILTFVSANYITTIITGGNMPPIFVFLAIQVVMALSCYVMGLLVAMNNDRDMIRAIDEYIEKIYGVDTFLFQGEMHYQIINRKSNFTFITGLSGGMVSLAFLGMFYFFRNEILQFIFRYPLLGICVFVELLGMALAVINNYNYKKTGKSKIKDDCYDFLKRNNKDFIKK